MFAQNHQFETGFIRVSATRFWLLRNRVFHWFYKVFRRRGNALRKRCVATGLLLNFGVIFGNGTISSSFGTGFIRVSHMVIPHVLKHCRTNRFLLFWNVAFSRKVIFRIRQMKASFWSLHFEAFKSFILKPSFWSLHFEAFILKNEGFILKPSFWRLHFLQWRMDAPNPKIPTPKFRRFRQGL